MKTDRRVSRVNSIGILWEQIVVVVMGSVKAVLVRRVLLKIVKAEKTNRNMRSASDTAELQSVQ